MNKLILTKQTSEIDTINLLSDTIQLTVKYDNFRKLTLTYHLHSPGCIAGRDFLNFVVSNQAVGDDW